ncbi:MAG: hypothetical protein IPG22_22645 [Acidobacteria bacterium]|nr:hypothetical protein [Acidobacteriota bacterium]
MRKAWKKKWLKELPDFEDFIQKGLENRRTVTVTSGQEKVILEEARKVRIGEVRYAVVTERMKRAFEELWNDLSRRKLISQNAAELDNLIFPHSTFKKSWNIVREAAGLPGLRLRDLRRDWVTRLGRLGYSDKLAQRGAGHKKMQTSFEYTEFDETAALQAKALLDGDNQSFDQMSLSEPTK